MLGMLESLPVDSNAMGLAVARWRGFIELGEVGGEDIAVEVIGGDFLMLEMLALYVKS